MAVKEQLIGLKVVVLSPNKSEVLGDGEIVRLEKLIIEETGEILSEKHPVIRLKDGRELLGIECWWIPKPCNDDSDFSCQDCALRDDCSEVDAL